MSKLLKKLFANTILKAPLLSLLAIALLSAASVTQLNKLRFDASSDSLVMEGDKALALFRDVGKRYGSEDFLIVTYSPKNNDSLFADQHLQNIQKLQEQLKQLEPVSGVNSIMNVPLLYSPPVTIATLSDGFNYLSDADIDKKLAQAEFKNSPVYKGLLTSPDDKTTVLQVNLKRNEKMNSIREQRDELRAKKRAGELYGEDVQALKNIEQAYEQEAERLGKREKQLVADVRGIMDGYRGDANLFLGGVAMVSNDMLSYIRQDLVTFGLAIFAFIIFVLGVVFRQLRWIMLPMLACIVCVLVTTGLMALFGWKLTVISANFIALLLILTLSVTVHLVVRYRELEDEKPSISVQERVKETVQFMFKPCLFTTLTTIVAFASLVVSGIRPVIDFGWMMTLGVIIALLVTFVILPAGMLLWKKDIATNTAAQQTPPLTGYIANFAEKFSKLIIIAAVLLAAISAYGISQLIVENRFIDYFDESTEIYQGMETIDAELGGVIPLDIILRTKSNTAEEDFYSPEGEGDDFADDAGDESLVDVEAVAEEDDFADIEDMDEVSEADDFSDDFGDDLFGGEESGESQNAQSYWFTRAGLDEVKTIHEYIDGLDETGKTLSLNVLYQIAKDILGGSVDDIELAILQQNSTGAIKTAMVDPYLSMQDGVDETRITVRIKETSRSLNRNDLIKQVDKFMHEEMGYDKDQYDLTGLLVLYNNMLQSLFKSQILTLGAVFIAIIIMFLVLFRSLRIALIAIAPNLLAAALVLGCMGLLKIPLDMMTITIAAITVGIGVDNSIHYIYRFKEEFAKDQNYLQTMHRSHRSIGKAMFYTSITIIVGFSILVLSNFTPSIYFGFLTAFAMLSALLGNLLLLPQLLRIVKPFGSETKSGS